MKSRWLILAALAVVILFVARSAGDRLPEVFAWVEGLGAWGPIAYVAIYVTATVLLVPGSLITLAGGAIFGLAEGVAYVFAGAVIGSGAAFLIGRYLARDAVEARISQHAGFSAVDRAVQENGLKMVFLLRLSPAFPFSLLNYGLGLTSVTFRDYMLAAVGMLPGTVLYVYYGQVAGDLARLASGVPQERDAGGWAVLLMGLAATIAVTVVVTRLARNALAGIEGGDEVASPDAAETAEASLADATETAEAPDAP